MSAASNGGPAFAGNFFSPECGTVFQQGMSIRDYFAARAMQAIVAKLPILDREGQHGQRTGDVERDAMRRDVAESAYDYAMLKERARNE